MVKQTKKIVTKRGQKKIQRGIVHIQARINNTIVSITDMEGQVISWASAGTCGFKGARKGTPFAGQTAAESATRHARELGLKQVDVFIKGPGAGRETAIRGIYQTGLNIRLIQDRTSIPHNGCRNPKKRRV